MVAALPWAMREATVTAMVFAVINNGVETSLAKALGALYLTFVVFALMVRFAFPHCLRWLDHRAALARRREAERRLERVGAEP
jgi:hypothetical protein